jgi:aminoglycoside 3-N-acetyltransferase
MNIKKNISGIISRIYNKFVLLSPQIEVSIRQLYWKNVKSFHFLSPGRNKPNDNASNVDFEKIIEYLKKNIPENEKLWLVHSSYEPFKNSGISPAQIIDSLLSIIGNDGTLAMPVIRSFEEENNRLDYIKQNYKRTITKYDVARSQITSGYIPFVLTRYEGCCVSRFPLNPLAAVGKLAKQMMEENISEDNLSAHGVKSAWKFCADNNAVNIGLGVDIKEFLTIMHVDQEANENWPVKDWYDQRKFLIIDGKFKKEITILERKHRWTMYYAERNFLRDLIKRRIIISQEIDGINILISFSNELFSFLNSHPRKGYPYYVNKKHLKYD